MSDLKFARPDTFPASDRRLLLVFDGGNAPGYASVAVALTEEGNRRGYEVWTATEGFRSLTSDASADPAFERLISSRRERYALLSKGIPTRSMGRRVLDAGSDFRSERYVGFFDRQRRQEAAATFRAQGFTHLTTVGGNGTFAGTKALLEEFATRPPTGFVNVSTTISAATGRSVFSRASKRAPPSRGACMRMRIPTSAFTSSR
jgi:6-phosphofructokinase